MVSPSMKVLRRVETHGISIPAMFQNLAEGKPQVTHVATLIHALLTDAGAAVTEDDIYSELMSGDPDEVQALTQSILMLVVPEARKKPSTPPSRGKSKSKK